MSIPLFTDDVNIIGKLNSRPNLRDGLTDEQLKAKFDEAAILVKAYINDKLIPEITAKNVPFKSSTGNVDGNTVLEALEWLKDQISQSQMGDILENSIPADKFTADVRNILNSGIPIVSEDEPELSGENIEVAPGQIWLRMSGNKIADLNILLKDGTWHSFGEPVLPVRKGGTGRSTVSNGALLYGNGTDELQELAKPTSDDFLLSHTNGAPAWKDKNAVKSILGYLNVAEGEYTGNGEKREIELTVNGEAIAPKILIIYRMHKEYSEEEVNGFAQFEGTFCLCEGSQIGDYYFFNTREQLFTLSLSNGKLIFDNKTVTTSNATAQFMNKNDESYKWLALY